MDATMNDDAGLIDVGFLTYRLCKSLDVDLLLAVRACGVCEAENIKLITSNGCKSKKLLTRLNHVNRGVSIIDSVLYKKDPDIESLELTSINIKKENKALNEKTKRQRESLDLHLLFLIELKNSDIYNSLPRKMKESINKLRQVNIR